MALTKQEVFDIVTGIKTLIRKVKMSDKDDLDNKTVDGMVQELELGLRRHIKDNAEKIKFTQPLYTINQVDEGHYDISINITGLGSQHFSLLVMGDEFLFKGKLAVIGSGASFPFSLVAALVNNAFRKWITQSAEDIAKVKAVQAAKKAGGSNLQAQVADVKQVVEQAKAEPTLPAANTP